MRNKILLWCEENELFSPGDGVLLALSGGADSVAMVHCLLALQKTLGLTLEAAHFNHHLRGAQSDRDEAFCRTLCAGYGLTLRVGGADVAAFAKTRGLGLEEAARKLRYDFLTQEARGGKIATAHNADDNLETMLINLLRGCGLRGLAGIPPRRGQIVRPLLCVSREEIEAYLLHHKLPHVEDSSNQTNDFLRNRLRHDALPALRRECADLPARALETACDLRADEDYLQSLAAALVRGAKRPGGYEISPLACAPAPLRLRALGQILRELGGRDLTRAHLLAADGLLTSQKPAARCDVPGVCLQRQYRLLVPAPPPALAISPRPVPVPGTLPLPEGKTLRCTRGIFRPHALPYPQAFALRPEAARGLILRSRLPGDRLTGPGGTKPLQKWMIDCKIPAPLRPGVPVLVSEGRVIAAFGVAADPSCKPLPGEAAIFLEIENSEVLL